MAVKVLRNGLEIDGKPLPLISGSVHYWRLDPELWPRILDSVKKMGFGVICTYIPWSVHEVKKGSFDFGVFERRFDIGAFLKLAAQKGLKAIVRPGPHINAELTLFGFPERVLKRKELLARTADGAVAWLPAPPKAFPVPSYACPEFYSEVSIYFKNLSRILKPLLHPSGPIIAIQADNENSLFFRSQPWDLDYHPDSIRLYRRFLAEKYGRIKDLNEACNKDYKDFETIEPPRDLAAGNPGGLPFHLDWIEYMEYYIEYGVKRIADMLRGAGLDSVPITHNFPDAIARPPFDIRRMEQNVVDIQGVDIYPHREEYDRIKIGFRKLGSESRLPFSPEFSSGFWSTNFFQKPITLDDQKFCTAAAFMQGLKAVNFYMIVERERWYGSPVARDGRIRKEYFDYYHAILKTLARTRLWDLELEAQALLLMEPDYWRLTLAASLCSPLVFNADAVNLEPEFWVREDDFGLGENIPIACHRFWNMLYCGLTYSKTPFTIATSRMPLEFLKKFKAVLTPSFSFLNSEVQKNLLKYANDGGTLVLGPRVPHLDEKFRPGEILKARLPMPRERIPERKLLAAPFMDIDVYEAAKQNQDAGFPLVISPSGQGRIVLLPFVPSAVPNESHRQTYGDIISQALQPAQIEPPIDIKSFRVDYTLLSDGKRRILFLANPTARKRQFKFSFPGRKPKLFEPTSGKKTRGQASYTVQLPPYGIRMWEVG